MSLFQKSVEKKYLNELDSVLIDKKYSDFQTYFANPERQENIRNSKEEQFQEGFLRELFVKILGYTLNPEPNFNLTTELKNIANSKKADGAILKGEDAIAVIELKGTDTTDLDKIETQAFGYKNHHPKCVYVITSNFEKLRFYIQNAVDHIDFDLFNLTREQFSLMWLCLAKDNLINNLPLKIKESSVLQEENITKKLYADYSKFREAIYNNLVKNNSDTDKLLLFKKTQKLLDRFLFIFFAEDRLLLPPNSISEIVKQWTTLKDELDEYVPLYARFKKYFSYMNTGFKGKRYDIYAYNGGLFKSDEILDNIIIDDEILHEHTLKLSNYDFETDVDVNILGHIFEHSLGEIENVQAEIKGEKVDSQKTKRKKDGIFYTPKYITKYIVENTVGKLCEEKMAELEIIDEEYAKGRKNRKKDIVKALDKKLTTYRNWLLTLTILDPACGSGAFLNQALDFLINEHQKIDELRAQLFGGGIIFSDISTDILEKNIYGVDLNEESVDIAKLSLWLRTAQKGRKLNTLSNNIKCGNSLIDDPEVAGEKAFNWQNEFPEVFENGGFDVVIGNPPYVQLQKMVQESLFLKEIGYKTFESTGDLYCLFYEKGWQVLKDKGLLGYITSNKWMRTNYGKSMRSFFVENTNPYLLIDLGAGIFESAVVDSNIILFEKKRVESLNLKALDLINTKEIDDFSVFENQYVSVNPVSDEIWIIENPTAQNITRKIVSKGTPLKDWDIKINYGIKTGYNDAFIINESVKKQLIDEDQKSAEILKPILRGRDIKRYFPEYAELYLIGTFPSLNLNIDDYPAVKAYLESFGKRIEQSGEKGSRKKTPNKWFETQDTISYHSKFNNEKIIYPNMTKFLPFIYDNQEHYLINDKAFILLGKGLKYLVAYLNSSLAKFQIRKKCAELQGGTRELRKIYMENIRIPLISEQDQFEFNKKADLMLSLHKEKQVGIDKFLKFLKTQFKTETFSNKLLNWHEHDFRVFIGELNKSIKNVGGEKLSKTDEMEWLEVFETKKAEAHSLKSEIDKTDKEIDQMVFELYGLSEDEIKIVEGS